MRAFLLILTLALMIPYKALAMEPSPSPSPSAKIDYTPKVVRAIQLAKKAHPSPSPSVDIKIESVKAENKTDWESFALAFGSLVVVVSAIRIWKRKQNGNV